jgi:5-histidylcysteine sulfoxide synthase/putative 4-mercaptohistidine N1-methyltranferase
LDAGRAGFADAKGTEEMATTGTMQVTRTTILNAGDPEQKREEIRAYFHATYDIYERLFEGIADDAAYFMRPEPLRHPLIFYFGHTAVFFVNKLRVAGVIDERVDARIESMMAIGVDEMSWDDLNDAHYDWASVAEVQAYRDKVRTLVDGVIDTAPMSVPISWDSPFWIVMMGIEHERIHLETSSVLIRQLPINKVHPVPAWPHCGEAGPAPENALVAVPGGRVAIGKDRQDPVYGWDIEYGTHQAQVSEFNASRYLVSNGEYRAFVDDGGYANEAWWTDEGWRWRTYKKAAHPLFWVADGDGGYRYRAMLEEIEMPWNWPVDVNYLEAKAFCNWLAERTGKSLRLPTEDEWYRMAGRVETDQPDWDTAPGNVNLEYWASACPVDRFEHEGLFDVIGNVWQWTETPIDAFDGFAVHPSYDDFSVPTLDGKHNLIKGGSWISTGNEATRDARYAFRRHFPQHAGFRYVEAGAAPAPKGNIYETDASISEYLEFHYGDEHFGVANFPVACVEAVLARIGDAPKRKALDIGCSVGRSSFELARHFDEVDALDFSTRFIASAIELQEHGVRRYAIRDEGDLMAYREARLDGLALADTAGRVSFAQNDACNLKATFTGYDLIFAANLIDRLYDPNAFLEIAAQRLVAGGYLAITSPYTWLEEYTEKDKWLGGYKEDGENVTGLQGLQRALARRFVAVGEPQDIPFVIRETRRKFQHTVAEFTLWRRRSNSTS